MARFRYQKGSVLLYGDVWYGKYREDEIRDGTIVRVQRRKRLGTKKEYPTKRLAERMLEQVLARINDPGYRPGRVGTVEDFAERWKTEVLSKRKPSTVITARSHLDMHIIPLLGKLRMDALGPENQQAFVTRLAPKVSHKSLLNILGTLSSMLTTAKNWGYICEGVTRTKLALPDRGFQQEARCFTAGEVQRILMVAEDPWRLMFAIAAMTGLRAGEVLGLRVEDVDLQRKILTIHQTAWQGKIQTTKTKGSETTVPIPEGLCALLEPALPKQGLLFVNKLGKPYWSKRVVEDRLWPILEHLNIPRAGFHAFRHTHASLLLESGASPKVAQRQLRHSDARITLGVYAHVVGDAHREAVEKVASLMGNPSISGPKLVQ